MSVIIFSAIAALALVAITLTLQLVLQKRRLKRFHDLQLIPNILLTTHPVLFIGRNRSLFRLSGDFLELPIYLREHGFQVEEVELQTRGLKKADILKCVSSLLQQTQSERSSKTHLFLPEALGESAFDLAFDGHPNLASLTVIGADRINRVQLRPPRVPLHVRPDLKPQIAKFDFQTERSTLDHVVSLAESDLR
jgi:hypothetical protein